MSTSRKRKQRSAQSRPQPQRESLSDGHGLSANPVLFIQAHEADIARGPQAWASARALEIIDVDGDLAPGEGLIRWSGQSSVDNEGDDVVWVDRYDARLLLDSLPTMAHEHANERSADVGWDDLPSDSEDTFFLSPAEVESYRRDKRRRFLDASREARLKALQEEDPEPVPEPAWASDEEPDETQSMLMRRTAAHLASSPNRAALEMRILANHGADPRFAFLRGRWKRAWALAKARQAQEEREKEAEKEETVVLGGLAGYGSASESESGGEGDGDEDAEVAVKLARRVRAREWAERRRAVKANGVISDTG